MSPFIPLSSVVPSHIHFFFSHISCQSRFSQGSIPAPGEFNLSLSIDLDDIMSGLMSFWGGERDTVKLFCI